MTRVRIGSTAVLAVFFLGAGAALVAGTLAQAQPPANADVRTVHVKGNVHMIIGAGANIAVQVGEDGVVVVDTGTAAMGDKVVSAIRRLSNRDIRWIVNTTLDPDHVGGNEAVSQAGRTVNGNPAAIISHEKLPIRMLQLAVPVPVAARPLNTFYGESKDFPFNDEAVFVFRAPGRTDGDTFVYFPRSDVIVAGDVFLTTTYPNIDARNGGTVQGAIDGLNRMLELAVTRHMQEGGTVIIPGHGRLCDEADVVEYRDMLVIVRDRVQDAIKKGMTLDQVKSARLTRDYDPRYAAPSGPASTASFVEAVYRDQSAKK